MKSNEEVVVYDIETDGLLHEITKVWVIAATSLDGEKRWIFSDQDTGEYEKDGSLEQGVVFLKNRKKIICHNQFSFDYIVLEKFFPHLWDRKKVPFKMCWDTLAQSRSQHYDRHSIKGVKGNHGLEYWGVKFGYPKPPIEDWSYWDAKKLDRCLVDIEINRRAYIYLQNEAKKTGLNFTKQVRRTQAAQYFYQKQEMSGLYGNRELMEYYRDDLDKKIEELRKEIEPNLPKKLKPIGAKITWQQLSDKWDAFFNKVPKEKYDDDGKLIKDTYMPVHKVYLKSGLYNKSIAKHFDIDQDPDVSGHYVAGAVTRIDFEDTKMSQHAIVKDFLLSLGWKPTQWNFKKDDSGAIVKDSNGNPIKMSPKLTEDSFDSLEGGIGEKIAEYNTLTHRRRTIQNEKDDDKGWINQLRSDGRISAGAMAWATGTGRAAQFGIVNVPSGNAVYGAPMREVWCAPEGSVLVSVDMDSAQMRLLANFMGDDDYTRAVIEGKEFDENGKYVGTDAHTLNAMAFGTLSRDMRDKAVKTQDEDLIHEISGIRKIGKNGFYGLLFGAGDVKLANTLKVRGGAKAGKVIKQSFRSKLRKAADLQDRLEEQWENNPHAGGGYIQVAGNTWVWCPSKHKLLNYLLMGSEAVLQNEAIIWLNIQIEKRGLTGAQKMAIHDEITAEFPLEEEEEGKKVMSEMYGECSKRIGLDVLVTGTAKSGKNWLEVH